MAWTGIARCQPASQPAIIDPETLRLPKANKRQPCEAKQNRYFFLSSTQIKMPAFAWSRVRTVRKIAFGAVFA